MVNILVPMLAPTLSPRLVALPLWFAHWFRTRLLERKAPLLVIPVSARHPLPPASDLERVADSGAAGVWLRVAAGGGQGLASLQAVHTALLRLRARGKKVYVELEQAGNAEILLASAATRAWIRPTLQVYLTGIGTTLNFVGALFERFGLRFDVEAAGTYKSFGESFTRAYASSANREAMQTLVDGLESELEGSIAEGRKIPLETVKQALADAPLSAAEAVRRGLVDAVAYADQAKAEMKKDLGREVREVSFARWAKRTRALIAAEGWINGLSQIAVVHLKGAVVDGEGVAGSKVIASLTVVEALEALVDDEEVKAVVLAIDSGGGSATASDAIWRAVTRIQQKKPVVAVLGNVAASGGYYIAVGASEILASPATITGSIGVVGGKLVVGEALARQGVHLENVMGAPEADLLSPNQGFRPEQRIRFRAGLQEFYRIFLDRVSAGRRRPVSAIAPYAEGRVWTGRQALAHGLVDSLGTLQDGIQRAARLASVERPLRVDLHPAPPTSWLAKQLRESLKEVMPEMKVLSRLGASASPLLWLEPGVWALCPYVVEET